MTPATGRSSRLIQETLDSIVSPGVRDSILTRALGASALSEVPSDPEELHRFVQGPLKRALIEGLGNELAASVLEELTQVARLWELASEPLRHPVRPGPKRSASPPPRRNTPAHRMKAVRTGAPTPRSSPVPRQPQDAIPTMMPPMKSSRPPVGRPAFTPPPQSGAVARPGSRWGSDEYPAGAGPIGLPTERPGESVPRLHVLLLSEDAGLARDLSPWLEDGCELHLVGSLMELVREIDALADSRISLVLDCRRPSVRPSAVAALADELPAPIVVVAVAPTAEQERAMLAASPMASRFVLLPPGEQPKELARHCMSVVG